MTWLRQLLCYGLLALSTGAAGATVLTYATPYGPNHPFSRADKAWMAWVAEKSGGSLTIRPIWSGGLISSDQSLIELRHGVADIGLITPIYAHGGAHLLRVQTGFYAGAKTFEQQVEMYRCLAADSPEYALELRGLKVLAIQGGTLPGLLSRTRQVRTLSDLKGMRIRVPTELLNVMRDLGADPVTMPMGEVYSSLAKGVLDAVVAPTDTLKSLHFGEVAKYYTELQVPRGAYPARAMGERRWNALNLQEQRLLDASTAIWEAAMAKETRAAVQSGEAEGRAQQVQFIPVNAQEQKRFDELYEEDASRSADMLGRLGIDGAAVFRDARQISLGIQQTGTVKCAGRADATT
ncbi:MAG TPA: TRAP transporter substrate-binding protein DctP [Steroidobacteraceae bacterium]|nr:TRAP transporter substrate-binding protein DctP [Steroidobacteraceae bacterium]